MWKECEICGERYWEEDCSPVWYLCHLCKDKVDKYIETLKDPYLCTCGRSVK